MNVCLWLHEAELCPALVFNLVLPARTKSKASRLQLCRLQLCLSLPYIIAGLHLVNLHIHSAILLSQLDPVPVEAVPVEAVPVSTCAHYFTFLVFCFRCLTRDI